MRKVCVYCLPLLLLVTSVSCAQQLTPVQPQSTHHKVYKLNKPAQPQEPLVFPDSFTAYALETADTQAPFEGIRVVNNGELRPLKPAAHPNPDLEGVRSEVIMPPNRTDRIKLKVPKARVPIKVHLLDAKAQGKQPDSRYKKERKACQKPRTIPQENWRVGLPAPTYDPIAQTTNHVIIHHSAGNTGDTNTRQIIRNIYLFHTDVNEWSDIGYNFVIGVKGRIYQARDGMGLVPDHRVKGAHFCGKNSGTMGIALVGNFEEGEPSEAMLNSLRELLAWKMKESDLNPTAQAPHPPYETNPAPLKVIAGHKDGCATLCPGENLYPKIPAIRDQVADSLAKCQALTAQQVAQQKPSIGISHQQAQSLEVSLKNPNAGYLHLYNAQGKVMTKPLALSPSRQHYRLDRPRKSGIYILVVKKASGQIATTRKIFLP